MSASAGRSPAYPYIALGQAVELVRKIHNFAKGHNANIESIFKHLGFKGMTGSSKKTLAALKYFGLLEQSHGSKDAKLSKRAMQIIHGVDGSDDTKKALIDAFLAPTIYSYCWALWGDDSISDEVMKSHLILTKNFNHSTVQGFISDYKQSRTYSGIAQSGKVSGEIDVPETPNVGDYVTWESQGVLQFKEPRRVTEVYEEDGFLKVEGSQTGIPIAEVTIVEPPKIDNGLKFQGGQQNMAAPPLPAGVDMRQETFVLDTGEITIQWPSKMSQESFEDFTDWLEILKRKIRRSVENASGE